MIWMEPVIKTTYNDADYLRIQTVGLAIKNPINNKVNKNMFIIRYYTWPEHMSKPNLQRGSDDWCFMRRDSSTIASETIDNIRYWNIDLPRHTSIIRPEDHYVN